MAINTGSITHLQINKKPDKWIITRQQINSAVVDVYKLVNSKIDTDVESMSFMSSNSSQTKRF
jgi:hypothetical protein